MGQLQLKISKRYLHSALSFLGITALSVVLALVAAELILRYSSLATRVPPDQFLFSENPQHFRDQHSEFGYSAFSHNREVAIYYDQGNAWVEYDVSFTVNNVGLVQRRNIDRAKPYVVVVGDSFTQGQGANPWFYELEDESPTISLANLGVIGTGIQHWERAVDWFQGRIADVDLVVMIFISNDFIRPYWFAKSSPNETQFCDEVRCTTIYTKLMDESPVMLAQHRREQLHRLRASAASDPDSSRARFRDLLMTTQTGAMLLALSRTMRKLHHPHFEANKKSLQSLRARHNVAFALHLPEKHELSNRAWSADSIEIKNFVLASKLSYVDGLERCGLDAAASSATSTA